LILIVLSPAHSTGHQLSYAFDGSGFLPALSIREGNVGTSLDRDFDGVGDDVTNVTDTAQTVVASVAVPTGAASLRVRLSLFNNAMAEQVAIDNVMVLAISSPDSSSSSGVAAASTGAIVGGVLGCLLLVLTVALLIVFRDRQRRHNAANRKVVSYENPIANTMSVHNPVSQRCEALGPLLGLHFSPTKLSFTGSITRSHCYPFILPRYTITISKRTPTGCTMSQL
jgi:hypothetical protein